MSSANDMEAAQETYAWFTWLVKATIPVLVVIVALVLFLISR